MYHNIYPLVSSAALASDSTGDKYTFAIPFRCRLIRSQVVFEGTSAHATTAVIKFDKVPTAGSASGRGDGDCGVISKSASNQQGMCLYEYPASNVTLDEGDYVVAEVTTANGDACAFSAALLVEYTPERPANNAAMVSA